MARLHPWHRLSVRLAALFVIVTLIGIGLFGTLVYQREKWDLEETLGEVLLNIARTGVLLIDPALHAEVARTRRMDSAAYRSVHAALAAIQDENRLDTPVHTLADFDEVSRQARFMVKSRGKGAPGDPYALAPELIEPLGRTFREGVATSTPIYHNANGTWITAFAPLKDQAGRTLAVLAVDYRIKVYRKRLAQIRTTILHASVAGALLALTIGLLLARRITRPVSALTAGVGRVAAGDLSGPLPVRSNDEVGRLTRAFNAMLAGLRQRDFIRDTFGRYVSPEVAQTLLESPGALKLGGEKREVTVLMSDLRGYTRFAERGEPQQVTEVLNEYLGRMTDVIVRHGGTVNEFIGDAIFAVFGAPVAHPDHAERAAAAALAMQRAMAEVNRANAARGLPRFEIGIGVNTGEAVVGNIGSTQRAKYAVVGNAVNVAARIESATVGGQIFVSAATYERIRAVAEVGSPVPVEVKGIAAPLLLYELRGIGGRFAQRLPEAAIEGDPQVDVALPLTCRVIDGTVVGGERVTGTVRRLGTRRLDVRLDAPLSPLANVRLRLSYPGLGYDSGDLYGKVVGGIQRNGERLTQIRLTSVDPEDQKLLEEVLQESRAAPRRLTR
jgi:class 3 adenylate cyclase